MNEIIKRCQSGERAAFDELVRKFYPYVTGYLMKLTADEMLTQDLTQDVFLKVIRSIDSFKLNGKASFATYIITIAKNCYIDHLRRTRAAPDEVEDTASGEDIEQKVLDAVECEQIAQLLNTLPPNQAFAIRMKYIDDLTLKEIAQITGVEPKTVKSRIHEGTKKLRMLLRGKE